MLPRERWVRHADLAVVALLVVFHLASFGPASAVNGPNEIYGQDSVYILQSLAKGVPYPWNPQNHLLYHALVEFGWVGWRAVWGWGAASAYVWLKVFTAACGLIFYLILRRVLRELGLGPVRRSILLVLSGVSVSLWFHFSAFETHCTALPALAAYLLALVRLRERERTLTDRVVLIASLLVCGWSRIDLFRFALFSAPLPFVSGARRHRRTLLVDLAFVALLGVAGNTAIASIYFDVPPWESVTTVFNRNDRPSLRRNLERLDYLTPSHLADVGRAVTVYSFLAPIEPSKPGRSFFAPPTYHLHLVKTDNGVNPSTGLYLQLARNLLGNALSALALAGVLAVLGVAGATILRKMLAGDPLHSMIAIQVASGWLFYTWFNPHEPFLWVAEFLPLWIVAGADGARRWPGWAWLVVTAIVTAVALHNFFAFYLPFR